MRRVGESEIHVTRCMITLTFIRSADTKKCYDHPIFMNNTSKFRLSCCECHAVFKIQKLCTQQRFFSYQSCGVAVRSISRTSIFNFQHVLHHFAVKLAQRKHSICMYIDLSFLQQLRKRKNSNHSSSSGPARVGTCRDISRIHPFGRFLRFQALQRYSIADKCTLYVP